MAAAPATPPPARETPGLGGLLQVSVLPWGTVTIDGGPAMETPFDKVSLAPGNHTVKIRNPGWELVERQVTIRPGQTEFLRVDFPKDGVRKP